MIRLASMAISVLALLLASGDAVADTSRADTANWLEEGILLQASGEAEAKLGSSVSIAGDLALVGANADASLDVHAGAALVFTRSSAGWAQEQKLLAADGAAWAGFGEAVATDGNSALVGAHQDDNANGNAAGAAYVFVRSGGSWPQQQKLLASDGASLDRFGTAVALLGDTALVGAPFANVNGTDSGAIYVFVRSAGVWTQQQKLVASDASSHAWFGASVAASGDTAVVGAPGDGHNCNGSAYVLVRSAGVWTVQHKLLGPNGSELGRFGQAVAIHGDTALVGASGHDNVNGLAAGSAYVFQRSAGAWTMQQELIAIDGSAQDSFGTSVAVDGDRAVVGAHFHSHNVLFSGAAYLFQRSAGTWSGQTGPLAVGSEATDYLGVAVSIAGDAILIGAMGDDNANGSNAGAAYVLAPYGQPCSQPDECRAEHCVDGVCCMQACGGGELDDCQACTAALTGADGVDGKCDLIADGTTCDDGSFCNGADSCVAGVCTLSPGDPCAEVDDGDADCAEACDESAGSCSAPDPDGTACGDGGSCWAGVCILAPGSACTAPEQCSTDHCADGVCCWVAHCGAYRCGPGGNCGSSCTSTADCSAGHECGASGRCEGLVTDATDDSSCDCEIAGQRRPASHGLGLAALLALAALRRRHR